MPAWSFAVPETMLVVFASSKVLSKGEQNRAYVYVLRAKRQETIREVYLC